MVFRTEEKVSKYDFVVLAVLAVVALAVFGVLSAVVEG